MTYFIAPLDKVDGVNGIPAYQSARRDLENSMRTRASTLWNGASPGGVFPTGDQFGLGPLRANDMATDVTDSARSGTYSFRKNLSGGAWRGLFSYTVPVDFMHGFLGFLVTEDVLNILQFRMEIGQSLFPIIDVQEAKRFDRFAILFKTDKGKELIADPKTRVLVNGYIETSGFQRVVPLGINIYRRPDVVIAQT